MFDPLWEENPTIQKMRADYLMKGRQEGRQEERREGLQRELQGLRHLLVSIVQPKYPDLVDLAQQQALHFENPEALHFLIQQVATAPNADIMRWHLEQKAL
jgi:predicted transposase YdaD